MTLDIVWIVVGIVFLYFGGELLVKCAVKLARIWGISPLVIGLTIVAFGTSSPELAATLAASFKGAAEVALGNVIGSNIMNLGLILSVCALISPLKTEIRFIRNEVPFMICTSFLLFPLLWDGVISRFEGSLLIVGICAYLFVVILQNRPPQEEGDYARELAEKQGSAWLSMAGIVIGLLLLSLGAHGLVEGAVNIARAIGVSESVIGLTLVAFSTSLPELASCIIAAWKHEPDIILGNIIGSNIFNILAILGVASLVSPISIGLLDMQRDFWVMMVFSILILPFLITGLRLGRREGGFLLVMYLGYVVYLYL
ncbi:MAG: sodium:calcium antiporter [Candidatus Omnitrophota bacterium]|jgi:cation:H+ antiporter|nr:MAG: sodium:calcium antiporter [Candidatus Omnitrophota bacterium]